MKNNQYLTDIQSVRRQTFVGQRLTHAKVYVNFMKQPTKKKKKKKTT